MPAFDVINQERKKVGTIELSERVFAGPVNIPLVHQVLQAQLAGRRQGNASTKNKDEVRGGGKKPFRQKGTGNARQGSSRSPLMVGGGSTFGPKPRSYDKPPTKQMVRGALRSVLSDRAKAGRLLIVDEFTLTESKTRVCVEIFKKKLELDKALVVDASNEALERSARNIPHFRVLRTEGINVYDVIRFPWLVLTKRAALAVDARLSKEKVRK